MDFYQYPTTRDLVIRQSPYVRKIPPNEFYKENFVSALGVMRSKACAIQMVNEFEWEQARRPYYNVYPSITPMLLRLNLNVNTSLIKLPLPIFCIRFPKEHPPFKFSQKGKDWHLRSMLVGPTNLYKEKDIVDGFVAWIDTGEVDTIGNYEYPVHTYLNLPLTKDLTLEQSLKGLPYDPSAFRGMILPEEIRTDCARLICTLCLLENNPELIEPDVLADDRSKYEMTGDQKFVDRAIRRGKIGFNVGRGIEVIPHIRRPHLAIMHTGHGRTIPKIVMRKGSIIHRNVVQTLPTGFQGND